MLKRLFFIVATLSFGCSNGRGLLQSPECPAGQVRSGSLCISADSARLSVASCKDPDLAAVKSGVKITLCDGSLGVGTLVAEASVDPPPCTEDGQLSCIANTDFPSVQKSSFSADKIAMGTTIAGVVGTKRDMRQCRNAAHLNPTWDASGVANIGKTSVGPSFTADASNVDVGTDELNWHPGTYELANDLPVQLTTAGVMPTGLAAATTYYVIVSSPKIKLAASPGGAAIDITGTGSGTLYLGVAPNGVVDVWDTIDDYNNGLAVAPAASPWGSQYICDGSNFTNVSVDGLPGLTPTNLTPSPGGTIAFSQIWRDELTGSYFTNILSTAAHWSNAMLMCAGLDSGDGAGNWRLPTEKELMQLYVNGISRLPVSAGTWAAQFLSSTSLSHYHGFASAIDMARADDFAGVRWSAGYSAFCVR